MIANFRKKVTSVKIIMIAAVWGAGGGGFSGVSVRFHSQTKSKASHSPKKVVNPAARMLGPMCNRANLVLTFLLDFRGSRV